ncbi:hypothetical protein [Chitinophaga sp. Cy-1792]|uniref:hypothetical protein n=1 Tax=Chitinophaga sp. Cy-1792 TaxID=2608339 RepID=UPI0014229CF1|nr:hypothetical protein [Chitinophaga sp. Cy-1792]NIG57143.1 hypothetical protein [Chitinophaga sp. Cy-1792]
MQNPLVLFTVPLLKTLLDSGYTLFVRQSYLPGVEPGEEETKEAFLITPYTNIGLANQHFQAIRFDKRKYIYQAHRPEEVEKLYIAAGQPPGFKVYSAWLKGESWEPDDQLAVRLRKYMQIHTNWRPNHTVEASLEFEFGVLYIFMRYGQEELKIPYHQLIAG